MTRLILLEAGRANGSPTPVPRFPDEMIASLRAGGAVIFPTDTLYGLGVDPRSETGLDRMLGAKGPSRGEAVQPAPSRAGAGCPVGGRPADEIVGEFTGAFDWVLWGGAPPHFELRAGGVPPRGV